MKKQIFGISSPTNAIDCILLLNEFKLKYNGNYNW